MSDILNNASSGLLAFQRAISTTSHNIANSRTEGYSRQRVELTARPPDSRGIDDKPGNGVTTLSIQRQHDRFATAAALSSTSQLARESTHRDLAGRIDNLVADESLGLGPALSGFYTAIEDAAAEPGSKAARQALLSEAEALGGRFGSLQSELDDTRIEVNDRLRFEIDSLNDMIGGVAELNARITASHGRGGTNGANDLLDQRDVLVSKIAEHIDVTPLEQTDKSINLIVGNGTALVLGAKAHKLHSAYDPTGPARQRLEIETGDNRRQPLANVSVGGSIGGLIDFATEMLDPVRHRIGRLALISAAEINAQHESGLDANGEAGEAWFSSAEPETLSSTTNTGNGDGRRQHRAELRARGVRLLAALERRAVRRHAPIRRHRHELIEPGHDRRARDHTERDARGQRHLPRLRHRTRGRTLRVDPRAHRPARPRRHAGRDGRRRPTPATRRSPSRASPNANNADLRDAVDIRFTSDSTFDVVDRASGVPVATAQAYTPGATIAFNGWSTSLTGKAAAGDVHGIELNVDGSGDNSNALALVALQSERSIGGVGHPERRARRSRLLRRWQEAHPRHPRHRARDAA